MKTVINKNKLMDLVSTKELILKGHVLVLAADESLLLQLPKGNWIGSTMPYFYLEAGNGRMDKTHIMVSDFTDIVEDIKIISYEEPLLHTVCTQGFQNGFNFLILPALRNIHMSFALHSPNYPDLFLNPLIGIIAGADLSEFSIGKLTKTFNGFTGESYTEQAVALHAKLPDRQVARIEMINVFEPSNAIDIEVEQDGFVVENCLINGVQTNLYDYITKTGMDISYPLVSNYAGAIINVSFQRLDDEKKQVVFYAPLFKGKKYTTSLPFDNYAQTFKQKAEPILAKESHMVYNCNCILNYLYGGLDKNSIGFSGAATFGEIAYNLVNQTFTYLAIDEQ